MLFRARSNGATSAVEIRLRVALAEHYRVSTADDANAVRIEGDFYGFKHVLPDIPWPNLRVAVVSDSPGRYRDGHIGRAAERDRFEGLQALAEVAGRTVIRVRIGGLEDVDHARCVIAKDLTKTATNATIALVADPRTRPRKFVRLRRGRNAHPSVVK